jgi:hypothetical protein
MSTRFSNFAHFRLRRDLPEELCFYEAVRQPMSREEYEATRQQRGYLLCYEDYRDQRLNHTPRLDVFGIYALRDVAAGNCLRPLISDYWNYLYIDYEGLFQDVVAGVRAACGLGLKDPCPILALAAAPETKGRRDPTHFVRHDTKSGVATVLPWNLYKEAIDPTWEQNQYFKSL